MSFLVDVPTRKQIIRWRTDQAARVAALSLSTAEHVLELLDDDDFDAIEKLSATMVVQIAAIRSEPPPWVQPTPLDGFRFGPGEIVS